MILLDLKSNKYFGLGPDDAAALWSMLNHQCSSHIQAAPSESQIDSVAHQLLDGHLITTDGSCGKPVELIASDCFSGIGYGRDLKRSAPINKTHVVKFVAAVLYSRLALRMSTIETIVSRTETRKRQRTFRADRSFEATDLVLAFCRIRPFFYSAKNACLFDSFVLIEFLARYNVYPDWVFGVRTQPFGAHSWVQSSGVVLNDLPEKVREFAPILSI